MFKIPVTIIRAETKVKPPTYLPSHIINPVAGNLFDGGVTLSIECGGTYSVITSAPRDPALDIIFDCDLKDSAGNPYQGKLIVTTEILGTWL